MPVQPAGTRPHYRIVEKIGEGGMGVVWRGVGTTLDREVANNVLPEAFAIGLGIATALEAAHAAGVVHRDLKPANIKVTPDGKVKVLDSGRAKAPAPEPGSRQTDASLSPTMTSVGSIAGMILGTADYMSPGQVRGQAADARAEMWPFGVVLLEMLSGRKLFGGQDRVGHPGLGAQDRGRLG